MTGRRGRIALWCLGLLLSMTLFYKGRVPTKTVGIAPFFSGPDGKVTVRLAGDLPCPGVYRLPPGTLPESVTKMTLPGHLPTEPRPVQGRAALESGDILTLTRRSGQPPDISITSMGAKERMLLGIALDADRLSAEEWSQLPGIGPVLAQRIAKDRQSNGVFGGIEGVLRVSGIGPGKLARIRSYF